MDCKSVFFQAEDGIRDADVTGVQTCALPIYSWKDILQNDEVSAELYYNLGNAYYRLNQIGPSIYYYEKALQLAPNDADIKNNLAFAENARIDAIEPLPQSIFTT